MKFGINFCMKNSAARVNFVTMDPSDSGTSYFAKHDIQNVVVGWLVHLLFIPDITGSNLRPKCFRDSPQCVQIPGYCLLLYAAKSSEI